MSRFKRFTHSLLSGYIQLAVNSAFTLVTVRMALHYLSKAEYGLWMPIATIAIYINLLDFGLSAAAARIFVDYKDHHQTEEYGAIIQTSIWVGLTQAALVFLAGIILAFILGPLLHMPHELDGNFFWLVLGQCTLTAAMFATRFVSMLLTANQRFDVNNYANSFSLIINCGVMWWGFSQQCGIFSMLWGQAAGVVSTLAINWLACQKLHLFPRKGQWGRPTWEKFGELFVFGRDIFLFSIGNQLINFSQIFLLTRLMGLETVAIWSVCTRGCAILLQLISRVFDYSTSALAEMMVRGERERLLHRFREIEVLSVNMALAGGALLAVCNSSFVDVWTSGKIHWLPWNDLLLAVWMLVCLTVRAHTGLVGQVKAFRLMPYFFLLEGSAFIGLTILLHRFGGIAMMLGISIVCSLCCTLPYGLRRTREYFHLDWIDLARWHRSSLVLAATVAPVAVLVWWLAKDLPALQRLLFASTFLGSWTGLMFLHYGLPDSLRAELCERVPIWARPILASTRRGKQNS